MKRSYLTVFEGVPENWSAFVPDIPGTGGLGRSIEEARESQHEGILSMLEYYREQGKPAPEAVTTKVDFAEFHDNPEGTQYVIEWLTIDVPELKSHPQAA